MLRLASSTVVPSALRAIASPRILSQSITNALSDSTQEYTLVKWESTFIISHHFSTDAKKEIDHKVVNILKHQVKSNQLSVLLSEPSPPAHFPFTIQDNSNWDRNITLLRELDGEIIEVLVHKPQFIPYDDLSESDSDDDNEDNGCSDGSSSTDHNSNEQKGNCLANAGPTLKLDVKISKENGATLCFGVFASAAKIDITSMSINEPTELDSSKFCGPENPLLNSELQLALREFLEIRGIKKSYVKFLHKYAVWKSRRIMMVYPYELSRKLKKFMKKFVQE